VAGTCDLVCGDCVDADNDGYGVGMDCLGGDCNDMAAAVTDWDTGTCWSGDPAQLGVGACRAGTQVCVDGMWSGCIGEVRPALEVCNGNDDDCNQSVDDGIAGVSCGLGECANTSNCVQGLLGTCTPRPSTAEVCGNGLDDDCDGSADENCNPCLWVSTTGSDTNTGGVGDPYQSINAAIAAASPGDQVCVLGAVGCQGLTPYVEDVVMANGVSVFGSYESLGGGQCATITSQIRSTTETGLLFPLDVNTPTTLDGFTLDRVGTGTVAAITVYAENHAVISNVQIPAMNSSPVNAFGVNVVSGNVTITRSRIEGGPSAGTSVGVKATNSTVNLVDNCSMFDASGRCSGGNLGAGALGIVGRTSPGGQVAYGISLENPVGGLLSRNNIAGTTSAEGTGVRLLGAMTGLEFSMNYVEAFGSSVDGRGVHLSDCGGTRARIVQNALIAAGPSDPNASAIGVLAEADCPAMIAANSLIAGGVEGSGVSMSGVVCRAGVGGASQCIVAGNALIRGSSFGQPPDSAGVRCEQGSCAAVTGNFIRGNGGVVTKGLVLEDGSTFVDSNSITGDCGATEAVGVHATDSAARIQNNAIVAGECGMANSAAYEALRVSRTSSVAELDVHSNVIDARGDGNVCVGVTIEDVPGGVAGSRGIFRNNIIRSGACGSNRVFVEEGTASDPRLVQNNDFDPSGAPIALYIDEGTLVLNTAAAIDGITPDVSYSANVSMDPQFVAYPTDLHLSAGSGVVDLGTPLGAPPVDIDGQLRDAMPDIGADEL
jgi:hypothetical protein